MTKNEKGIKQLEDGTWKCDKVYKGVRICFKRKTKTEVISELKEKMKSIDVDLANDIIRTKNKEDITFEKLFEIYGNSRQWLPITYAKNRARFEKYCKEFINVLVRKVTNEQIVNWVAEIHKVRESNTISSNYANKILRIMKGMLTIAKDEGYCSRAISIMNIRTCKTPTTTMRAEKLESNYLTFSEFETLTKTIPLLGTIDQTKIDKSFYVFVLTVLYYSGCRINEARAIQVKDIRKSIERRKNGSIPVYFISITKQMEDNTSIVRSHLKSDGDTGRRIYIKKEIYNYIIDYCNKVNYEPEDYIFDYFKNGLPITRKTLSMTIFTILKKLHKENLVDDSFPTYLTPHGFRYSNTLYLKELGVSIEMAAQMQGHNVSTMLDIYSRIDKNEIGDIFGVN